MKELKILVSFCFTLLFISCKEDKKEAVAMVNGVSQDKRLSNVRMINLIGNPILAEKKTYFADMDENGAFTFDFSVDTLTTGALIHGDFFHYICLLPDDQLQITLDKDSISFSGEGAENNRYLYDLELKGLWNEGFVARSKRDRPSLQEFIEGLEVTLNERKRMRTQYRLSKEFERYITVDDAVFYDTSLRDYATLLARGNQDSLLQTALPSKVKDAFDPKKFMSDEKLPSHRYLQDVIGYVRGRLASKDTVQGFDLEEEMWRFTRDSLSGGTRDHVLAKFLANQLRFSKKYDEEKHKTFRDVVASSSAKRSVEKAINAYNEQKETLLQVSGSTFVGIQLETPEAQTLSFNEMLDTYKGEVVYLEVWLVDWYPDYPYRPKFPVKKLKRRFEKEPVKVVQVALTDKTDGLWDQIRGLSEMKEDHYYIKNPEKASFLNFYKINTYPAYFIFDKQGALRAYRAPAPPTSHFDMKLSDLESVLLELSKA